MDHISKNILLISGSGRNVGKTSFIREVILQNSDQNLVAIKITPHFHIPTKGLAAISITKNYCIYQETDRSSSKDSSLFLQAGAEKVIYIQTTDYSLEEAFSIARSNLKPNQPIIVESAALRKYIFPGLYLYIQKKFDEVKSTALEMKKLADVIIYSDGEYFSINPKTITFDQIWETNDNN